jgi:hypothetical protein
MSADGDSGPVIGNGGKIEPYTIIITAARDATLVTLSIVVVGRDPQGWGGRRKTFTPPPATRQ